MAHLRYITDYDFAEKTAIIRLDLNVPLDDQGQIQDDTRLQGAIPTVQRVIQQGGAAVLLAHLGRPQGNQPHLSMQHLLGPLRQLLKAPVKFVADCVGPAVAAQVASLQPGEVLLLENLRFHPGETACDTQFSKELAAWGNVYINDAFGTAHRQHASTVGIVAHFQDRLAGYLMEQECAAAQKITAHAQHPSVAIIGGAKISDKIKPLQTLMDHVDTLLLGGGVANTFCAAMGGVLGNSLVEQSHISLAKELLDEAHSKNVQVVLPTDVIIAPAITAYSTTQVATAHAIPSDWMALDIGPRTRQIFAQHIHSAKTLLWCGPIGVFEQKAFCQGTQEVATAVAQATHHGAFSLIGGGDSAASIKQLGYAQAVSHISTGGSALLHYLGGMRMPALEALYSQ